MAKKGDWTEEEFILLISRPDLPDDGFSGILAERSPSAIAVVRAGVHGFHTGGDTSPLSQMMLSLLGSKNTLVTCPVCRIAF
jgi:hypothetical protein